MSSRDPDVLSWVFKWLRYGDDDLRLARHGLKLQNGPNHLIAYHAQQCAEKHLKAYLVLRGVDFPFTHNIARLLELCSEQGSWADSLREAEVLTPFAVTTRYPGGIEEVTRGEARHAIRIAEQVRQVVRQVLTQEGLALPDDALR